MTRPGVQVVVKSAAPRHGAPSDTGVAFFAGVTERGRTDAAVLIHNLDEYEQYFGGRVSYGLLYDAADAAFQTGATSIYIGRVVGPAAANDSHTFNDAGAAPSIAVDTLGAYDSGYSAAVVAGVGGAVHVLVTDADGKSVTQSPDFIAPADFANWSLDNDHIRIRALGANVPAAAAAVALAGGADDRVGIDDAVRTAALPALFPKQLGPGQVAYPGATTTAMHVALLNFAQDTNRVALLDGADSADNTTAEAESDAIRASVGLDALSETFGHLVSPWLVIPGVAAGTTRTIPPSAVVAGLIAQSDGALGNPNVPAAGGNGFAPLVLRTSQPEWTDEDRESLNEHGVSVFRNLYGEWRLYGYRTLAKPGVAASEAWDSFAAARLRMAITNQFDAIGEEFVFDQIDGRGQKIAEWGGALIGILQRWWTLGALYGNSAGEAFIVDVGPTVNTPATIADKQLKARCGIKTSPFAELAYIEVTKVPITEVL